MKVLIAVPTKLRPYLIMKKKGTGYWLQHVKKYDWKVFVEPQEKRYYEQSMREFKDHLVYLPENDHGYSYAILQIKQYAIDNGYDLILLTEDDSQGYQSPLRKEHWITCEEMLDELVPLFKSIPDMGMVGFHTDMQGYTMAMLRKNIEDGLIMFPNKNKLVMSTPLIRTSVLEASEQILCNPDMYLNLMCRKQGFKIYKYAKVVYTHEIMVNNGGFTDPKDRYTRMTQNDFDVLAAMFPFMELKPLTNSLGKRGAAQARMKEINYINVDYGKYHEYFGDKV